MRHIVQTARETVTPDLNDPRKCNYALADKVTIGCATAKEAQAIAETMQFLPDRKVFAGVELYTEGGMKVVLSYRDLAAISQEARDLGLSSEMNFAAY